jgi:hypothetical protein
VEKREHPVSTPRADVTYLHEIRPLIAGVMQARRVWVREIGLLLEEARHTTPPAVAATAGEIGRTHLPELQMARASLLAHTPPRDCLPAHLAATGWLDAQIAAFEVMLDVGATGQVGQLRRVQPALAEGRRHAHRFNEEFVRVVDGVRSIVEVAARRRRRLARRSAGGQLAVAS